MKRKAQLQMGESVFVVFIIVIVILLGLVFYSKAKETSLNEQKTENLNYRLISLAQTVHNLPELKCSVAGTSREACIDKTRLELFSRFMNESKKSNNFAFNYYSSIFGKTNITFRKVYPFPAFGSGDPRIGIYDAYDGVHAVPSSSSVFVPVKVYDQISKTYSFGVLEIIAYN